MRKKIMKPIQQCLVGIIFALAFLVPGITAESSMVAYLSQAKVLDELGLFAGTEQGYELERSSTRAEAAVMLVRVLGQEKNIDRENLECPFQDVEPWAIPYVNLLYAEKLTYGVAEDWFGAADPIIPEQYMTYMLRILGYSDVQGQDFTWDNALGKASELGIIQPGDMEILDGMEELSRGGMVNLTYQTLFAGFKEDPNITLLEKLYLNDGVMKKEQLAAVAAYNGKVAEITRKLGIESVSQQVLSTQEIARRVSPAVFYLLTYDAAGIPLQSGSGFFITEDGVAVTNYHVIEQAHQAQIQTVDGQMYDAAGVLAYDQKLDLALLKIRGEGFTAVDLGDSDALETGQKVYSISSPLGFSNTFSEGIISNVSRWMDSVPYIQMTVPISSGSSGGVLLNEQAEVVGITTAIVKDGQSLNFALPINLLFHLTSQLENQEIQNLEEVQSQQTQSAPVEMKGDIENIYYEQENNNYWTLANFLNGPTTVAGTLDYWLNDMDYFEIKTIMPGTVHLTLLSDSREPDALAVGLVGIDQDGNVQGIAFADCVASSDSSFEYLLQYDLEDPGTYYIVIYSYKKQEPQEGEQETYLMDYQFHAGLSTDGKNAAEPEAESD